MAGWKFWERESPAPEAAAAPEVPVIQFEDLPNAAVPWSPASRSSWDNGEKFIGGFGYTDVLTTDYWTLRARSAQLFETNIYARGLVRRLVTNVINTGLHLEATPEEAVLGFEEDSLSDWSEEVETRFALWASEPWLCDHREADTFGSLQATAFREALVEGDVLCVLRQDSVTRLPRIQLIKGSAVIQPGDYTPPKGHKVEHGVELDTQGRQVAYFIRNDEGGTQRLPAYGGKSGRRMAWLVYASDKRHDQVRGKPLLSLVLQSLKEIDRYRDSTQRKATNNAMLTMVVEKEQNVVGSRPLTSTGAIRAVSAPGGSPDASPRSFNIATLNPSAVIDELNVGEKIKPFPTTGTDERFGDFEKAIVQAVAWTNEIPPEILTLAFSNNYSASQAAINEFKNFLDPARMHFGAQFCQPVYVEWLLSSVLARKVDAPGLFESWRDWRDHDVFAAWTSADWTGHVKPSVDPLKMAKGLQLAIELGLTTRDRAAREFNGTKFSQNAKKLRRENAQIAEANAVLQPPTPVTTEPDEDEDADAEPDAENMAVVRPLRG